MEGSNQAELVQDEEGTQEEPHGAIGGEIFKSAGMEKVSKTTQASQLSSLP